MSSTLKPTVSRLKAPLQIVLRLHRAQKPHDRRKRPDKLRLLTRRQPRTILRRPGGKRSKNRSKNQGLYLAQKPARDRPPKLNLLARLQASTTQRHRRRPDLQKSTTGERRLSQRRHRVQKRDRSRNPKLKLRLAQLRPRTQPRRLTRPSTTRSTGRNLRNKAEWRISWTGAGASRPGSLARAGGCEDVTDCSNQTAHQDPV